jgi:flagellar biosynthesis/type III secretory pathway protein FliH
MDPDALPEPFREPVYQRATRELQMLTKDAALRERYESRQKAIRDQMSLLEDALEEGLEKGREQGLEQGLEKGVLIGRVQLCQQILNRPVTPEEELLTLSIEELRQRAESMTAEFRGR